jgi:hypothetical protein
MQILFNLNVTTSSIAIAPALDGVSISGFLPARNREVLRVDTFRV